MPSTLTSRPINSTSGSINLHLSCFTLTPASTRYSASVRPVIKTWSWKNYMGNCFSAILHITLKCGSRWFDDVERPMIIHEQPLVGVATCVFLGVLIKSYLSVSRFQIKEAKLFSTRKCSKQVFMPWAEDNGPAWNICSSFSYNHHTS